MSIPKIAYFFWANERMSFLRYMTLYSFRKMNPDWEMVLMLSEEGNRVKDGQERIWQEEQDFTYYKGKCYLQEALAIEGLQIKGLADFGLKFLESQPPNIIADIFKWKVLGEIGGLISDMDILYFKPLPSLDGIENGLFRYLKRAWPIGFLVGSCGGMFRHAYDLSVSRIATKLNNYQDVGPNLFRDVMETGKYKEQYTILPNAIVYPFIDSRGKDQWQVHLSIPFESCPVPPEECFGIHWYGGSQVARKWMGRLQRETLSDYKKFLIPKLLLEIIA